jgi:transcriptional regulator with GAF, ATPase, and Fis domain
MASGPPVVTQILVRDGETLKLRTNRLSLEIVDGPGERARVQLDGPVIRVGSGGDCDLVLVDPAVSRHHFDLHLDARGVRVVDAGSRNGTRVDGVRALDAFVRDDSTIAVGQTSLRVRVLDELVDVPLYAGGRFGGLVGKSVSMRRLFALLERLAATDTTVLVEGETGTGKELVAEALHDASARAEGPFIVFDCSALSPTLIESELFGHVRGAFTGAVAGRVGAFEAADGGTLFLDEIGELPLDLQPKLLRVLERREIRRLGHVATHKIDVRVIAATHRDLAAEVERRAFREDLYYRLAVVRLAVPPLRERPDDIPLLVDELRRRHGGAELPPNALAKLQGRAWPGNVRELRNAVEELLALGTMAQPRDLAEGLAPLPIDLSTPLKEGRDALLERFERDYLAAALTASGGNVTNAAEIAGVHRRFIHRAIQRYRLR